MATRYRCIGRGTTDSQGIAHITHACDGTQLSHVGYKGVGGGLMDFVASTDDPETINANSLQSESYEVTDCTFFDTAYNGLQNNGWNNVGNYLTITPHQFYTTITGTIESSQNRLIVPTTRVPHTPFVVEFETPEMPLDWTGTGVYILMNNASVQFSTRDLNTATHIKFIVDEDVVTPIVDGVTKQTITGTGSTTDLLRFQINAPNLFLNFANFKVYPI